MGEIDHDIRYDPGSKIPVHIGLMGHIDAGKTSVAARLTEITSTSGLDKHPQSQERGITIDLGFTFFPLDEFMVTLVDAPGHADLIRSVVSGANIIDMGLLVIDASHGFQVQTGEHLVILDLLDIERLIVVVNKKDLVNNEKLEQIPHQINTLLKETHFEVNSPIVFVSAKENKGFDTLKKVLLEEIQKIKLVRKKTSPLKYLIDHHFGKKGKGTIVTGTVLTGSASIGENLTILPLNRTVKVKSIQKWKRSVKEFNAGDRCGVALTGVNPNELFRGCFLTNQPRSYSKTQWMEIDAYMVDLFKFGCKFAQDITVTHNMRALHARIFPYIQENLSSTKENFKIWLEPSPGVRKFKAFLWVEEPEYVELKDTLLLTRLDISPKNLRIMGTAIIRTIPEPPVYLYKKKIKIGHVKNPTYSSKSIIVEGLAESKVGAETLLGKLTAQPVGEIISTFGQKGNVEVVLKTNNSLIPFKIEQGDSVSLILMKKMHLDPGKSYEYLKKRIKRKSHN